MSAGAHADLWNEQRAQRRAAAAPLAVRMRPRTLDEFAGQHHILGDGMLLRRMIDADRFTSLIFWGPPGTGKTTLAELIATHTGRHFERANAAMVGVKDVRTLLAAARDRLEGDNRRTVLFLDEIHRFARNQQDVLLGDVENGLITLIGATTENPYFSINSALVSRSTLFQFEALTEADVQQLLRAAIDDDRAFPNTTVALDDDAIKLWSIKSGGDARRALNALELAVLSQKSQTETDVVHINRAAAEQSMQAKALVYDGTGDEHYDIISAFIKSMRGGDPDAAVYWLARMLEAGEDPRFIARRIAILASEDIGNADPNAINVAASAYQITERIGMPECQLTLGQVAIYMATAPKSNASAKAIWDAMTDVREGRTMPVPKSLRDSHYKGAQSLGHGENYRYPHNSDEGWVDQDYMGVERVFYTPTERGFEAEISRRLQSQKNAAGPERD